MAALPKMGPKTFVMFRPDHKSFGKFIMSTQMRKPVVEVAHEIAHAAAYYTPEKKGKGVVPDGTALKDRFEVNEEAGSLEVGPLNAPRVKVEVFNSARSAAPNEFGGKRNARHRMLGRAGAAFGDFRGNLGVEVGPQMER